MRRNLFISSKHQICGLSWQTHLEQKPVRRGAPRQHWGENLPEVIHARKIQQQTLSEPLFPESYCMMQPASTRFKFTTHTGVWQEQDQSISFEAKWLVMQGLMLSEPKWRLTVQECPTLMLMNIQDFIIHLYGETVAVLWFTVAFLWKGTVAGMEEKLWVT